MRTVTAGLVLAVGLGAAAQARPESQDPAQVPAGSYVLDRRHASLIAKVPHLGGFSRYALRFRTLDGGFTYDPADWRRTKVTITVDPKSVETLEPSFDKEVAGFLGADKYPAITFVSTEASGEGGQGQVTGDLTFHGVTKPVTLQVSFNGVGPGLLGAGTRLGFSGTGRIKRSAFGADAVSQFAGDDVDLSFEVEFVKK